MKDKPKFDMFINLRFDDSTGKVLIRIDDNVAGDDPDGWRKVVDLIELAARSLAEYGEKENLERIKTKVFEEAVRITRRPT